MEAAKCPSSMPLPVHIRLLSVQNSQLRRDLLQGRRDRETNPIAEVTHQAKGSGHPLAIVKKSSP